MRSTGNLHYKEYNDHLNAPEILVTENSQKPFKMQLGLP
jgi:hypothetical protein